MLKISDAGKRMAGIVNGKVTSCDPWEIRNQWMAFKLENGDSDGVLYDSKVDAVRHQLDEKLCCYLCFRNCIGGISALDADIFLKFNRQAYDAGLHMPDPDDPARKAMGMLLTAGGGPNPIHSVYRYPEFEIAKLEPWQILR